MIESIDIQIADLCTNKDEYKNKNLILKQNEQCL